MKKKKFNSILVQAECWMLDVGEEGGEEERINKDELGNLKRH